MDLIDRQAAVKALEETKQSDPFNRYEYQNIGIDWSIDAIKALPSAQQWIPCSRELPKPNEEDGNGFHKAYLVQDGRWMDVARWNGKYWVAWGYSTVLLNVVAWCELPTPYREGGQDGEG